MQDESALADNLNAFDQPNNDRKSNLALIKKPSIPTIRPQKSAVDLNKIGRNLMSSLNVKSAKVDLLQTLQAPSMIKSKESKTNLFSKSNSNLSKTDLSVKSNSRSSKSNRSKTDLAVKSNSLSFKSSAFTTGNHKSKLDDTLKSVKSFKSDGKLKELKFQKSQLNLKADESSKGNVIFIDSQQKMNLKRELDDLKRDLTYVQSDLNKNRFRIDKQKRKTLKVLNDILTFKHPRKGQFKKKKIVSRFISSSKLKKIEFISLIPSDRYARFIVPLSFFLFFYFYTLHFILDD